MKSLLVAALFLASNTFAQTANKIESFDGLTWDKDWLQIRDVVDKLPAPYGQSGSEALTTVAAPASLQCYRYADPAATDFRCLYTRDVSGTPTAFIEYLHGLKMNDGRIFTVISLFAARSDAASLADFSIILDEVKRKGYSHGERVALYIPCSSGPVPKWFHDFIQKQGLWSDSDKCQIVGQSGFGNRPLGYLYAVPYPH